MGDCRVDELAARGLVRGAQQMHAGFLRRFVSFQQIAASTCRHDVGPGGAPAAGARDHMIESQLRGRKAMPAVLARPAVTAVDVEARKSRIAIELAKFL